MTTDQYVFSTTPSETVRYRFPTHTNELVFDRSQAESSEAFVVILEPGEAPPLHQHGDTEQVFYILEGAGTLHIGPDGAREFRVKPGDVVRIPRNTLHAIECEGEGALIYLSVDCFPGGRPEAEPTFDTHTRIMCRENGWDYDAVRGQASEGS